MSKRIYYTVSHRLFCLLMAFHVINMSVDTPVHYAVRAVQGDRREDLSVNDIESLGELVPEECFGFTNAVPEHDEPGTNSSLTELEEEYTFTQSFVLAPFLELAHFLAITQLLSFQPAHIPAPVVETASPPPRFVV